ncbi:MAG: outer membrane protein assembly factor BamD [Moraxellaceae bacterium]|nr:outer membrane protein assembly factor BamD [Moraxellaceae bacterium]
MHTLVLPSLSPLRLALLLLLALMAGCASNAKKGTLTEKEYYDAAQRSMKSGNFQTATENLEAMESHYPVGQYTDQAQLDLIYAKFRHQDFPGASAAADRFMRLHPGHPQTDYTQYMKGLAAYEGNRDLITRYMPVSAAHRDLSAGRDAFREFALLIERFPDSPYAADARARMRHLRNQMAENELHVARYYAKRKAYVASLSRTRWIIENYPGAPAVPDALALQTWTYGRLGLKELAEQQLALLRQNYPEHPNLDTLGQLTLDIGSGNDNRSWLNIVSFGLLGGYRVED